MQRVVPEGRLTMRCVTWRSGSISTMLLPRDLGACCQLKTGQPGGS